MRCNWAGFTIVEFIIVIVLLGILSMTAISRSIQPSAFSSRLLVEALSSAGHHSSQLALSDAPLVSLDVVQTADDYVFTVRKGAVIARTLLVDRDSLTLMVSNSGVSIGPIDAANNLVVDFTLDGDVATAAIGTTALDPAVGIEISVQGLGNPKRCIQPTGYFAEAGC